MFGPLPFLTLWLPEVIHSRHGAWLQRNHPWWLLKDSRWSQDAKSHKEAKHATVGGNLYDHWPAYWSQRIFFHLLKGFLCKTFRVHLFGGFRCAEMAVGPKKVSKRNKITIGKRKNGPIHLWSPRVFLFWPKTMQQIESSEALGCQGTCHAIDLVETSGEPERGATRKAVCGATSWSFFFFFFFFFLYNCFFCKRTCFFTNPLHFFWPWNVLPLGGTLWRLKEDGSLGRSF